MKKVSLPMLILVAVIAAVAVAQGWMVRKSFSTSTSDDRNYATLESRGQLEGILAVTKYITGKADIRLDSIADNAVLELTIDFGKFTTGYPERDLAVFSKTFLNFSQGETATLKLLQFTRAKEWRLENEKWNDAGGTAVLDLGGRLDTVAVDLGLSYLEGNEFTKARMSGDLLHVTARFSFRLSDFGIRIPEEALLRLDDRIWIMVDFFASTSGV